jgi:GTP 3',8-cyclase
MKDSRGRNVDYLRVSVTDRCNLRCIYCMPEKEGDNNCGEDRLTSEDMLKVVKAASVLGISKIRYTGGEPLLLRGIDKLIAQTSSLPGIEDISITTNGILLHQMASDLKKAGLRRVNISLDTLDRDKFKSVTRIGSLDKVLAAIDKCLELDLKPVKINTVLIKGINSDEVKDFINFAREMPVEVRFIELMPIGEGVKLYEKGRMSFVEVLKDHPELIPVKTKAGSTAEIYTVKGAKGKIGFISPISCKFCSSCNRIRLTASGAIKPCLHSREEVDIRPQLNNEVGLAAALREAILSKPFEHHLVEEEASRTVKKMYQIGG